VTGEDIPRQDFLHRLQTGGYERRPWWKNGESSASGAASSTCFPPLYDQPLRLEFWGDTLESIRFFDPATQRSQASLEDLVLLPASEVILDEAAREQALRDEASAGTPAFGITSRRASISPGSSGIWRNSIPSPKPCGSICPRKLWWWSGTP
jgi:transcription-repair coupling factor (superfamily II helicase)